MFSVHHISLSVVNIHDSIKFYEKLGFKQVLQWEAENNSLSIVHMKLDDTFLELFCFEEQQDAPETAMSLKTDLPRVGIKHFGLRVDSIYETKDYVLFHKLADVVDIKRGHTDIDYFFIKDPSGNFIEFVQDDRDL